MAANEREQNGMPPDQDDDDFGDFGGFEAAEPVEPNVAQAGEGRMEAGANPWVAMFPPVSGSVSVQPDLLCGQNRFPQHLDNPITVDVAGSAMASVPPTQEEQTPGIPNGAVAMFAVGESPAQEQQEPSELNLDLANDILDGSFRSASTSQSGASFVSQGRDPLPDISGLDLALGLADDNSVENSAGASNPVIPDPTVQIAIHNTAQWPGDHVHRRASGQSAESETEGVSMAIVGQGQDQGHEVAAGGEGVSMETVALNSAQLLLKQAEEEKITLQMELEKQLLNNTRLTEDLSQAVEAAEKAQQKYDKVQKKHEAEMEELRQAGHETLAIIVEEYKELMKSTMAQQQESCDRQLVEKLKEESLRFQDLLHQQREQFDGNQKEQQQQTEDRLEQALQEQAAKEKELFDQYLANEQQKTEEAIKQAVQRESEAAAEELERVVNEERRKSKDMLEEQQERFKRQLAEEVEKNKVLLKEAAEKLQQESQEKLEGVLGEERERSRALTQEAVQVTREEMNNYTQQLRQADRSQHRRQLASLDLFLESARQQLSLLMNKNAEDATDDKADQAGSGS